MNARFSQAPMIPPVPGVDGYAMAHPTTPPPSPIKALARGLNFWYGPKQVLKSIDCAFPDRQVTAIIGPSGCGKSTLLRCFNRMHDLYPGNRYAGELLLYPAGQNI